MKPLRFAEVMVIGDREAQRIVDALEPRGKARARALLNGIADLGREQRVLVLASAQRVFDLAK